jgi:hypothetical protein
MKSEVAFFRIAVACQFQQQVIRPRRLAALKDSLQHGADDVPNFRPHLLPSGTQSVRMLFPEDEAICIIVEFDEVVSPPDQDREAGVQTSGYGGFQ